MALNNYNQTQLDSLFSKFSINSINIEIIFELGILNNPSYIVSLPDETKGELNKTINLMHELGGKASFSFLKIYPGTRIEEIAMEKGILPKDFSWAKKSDMRSRPR